MTIGAIKAVSIEPNGAFANVTLDSVAAQSVFANGFAGIYGNDPVAGNPTMMLHVTSMGFDNAGNPTTVARTIYGDINVRQVWDGTKPINPTWYAQQSLSGSDLVVRMVLSDYIFAKDDAGAGNSGTAITADFTTGFMTGQAIFPASTIFASLPEPSVTQVFKSLLGNITIPANQIVTSQGGSFQFPGTPTTITPAGVSVTLTTIVWPTSDIIAANGSTVGTPPPQATPILVPLILVPAPQTGVAVTNGSTQQYPMPVANWSDTPNRILSASDNTLRAVAFCRDAKNGLPVARTEMSLTDGTHTETKAVLAMTIDPSQGDANPICEYVATFSLATMNALATLTARLKVWPWIGDSGAILDTNATPTPGHSVGTAEPTDFCGPKTYLYDPSGTFAPFVAVVDPVSGNDATGIVYASLAAFQAAGTQLPFRTIAGACGLNAGGQAGSLYASMGSKHHIGGCTIYLRAGSHTWIGGVPVTPAASSPWWTTIQNYPTEAPVINSASGGVNSSDWFGHGSVAANFKFVGINVTYTGAFWFMNSNPATPPVGNVGKLWVARGSTWYSAGFATLVTSWKWMTQATLTGMSASNYLNQQTGLIRGCTFAAVQASANQGIYTNTCIGNRKTTPVLFGIPSPPTNTANTIKNQTLIPAGTTTVTASLLGDSANFLPFGAPIYFYGTQSYDGAWIAGHVTNAGGVTLNASTPTNVTIDFTLANTTELNPTGGVPFDIPAWVSGTTGAPAPGVVTATVGFLSYPTNTIFAFNYVSGLRYTITGVNGLMCTGMGPELHGAAYVQNLLEQLAGSQPTVQFAADGTTVPNILNLILWHNTTGGQRMNGPYDEQGQFQNKYLWSDKNNVWESKNIKDESFNGVPASYKNNAIIPSGTTGLQTINFYSASTFSQRMIPGTYTLSGPNGMAFTVVGPATAVVTTDAVTGVAVNINITAPPSGNVPAGSTFSVSGQDPIRLGNWPGVYGCGCEGTYIQNTGIFGGFIPTFGGLRGLNAHATLKGWARYRNPKYYCQQPITLNTVVTSGQVGTIVNVTLASMGSVSSGNSENNTYGGNQLLPAGTVLSTNAQFSSTTQLLLVVQADTTITPGGTTVSVAVGQAPASTASGTVLAIAYPGDIHCNTAIPASTNMTSLSLACFIGTKVLNAGDTIYGMDGSFQATVNSTVTLTTTPQAVAVTTVNQGDTDQAIANPCFSPAAYASVGMGDYHPGPNSPLLAGSRAQLLPYDLAGVARQPGIQISGAYYPNISTADTSGE